MPAEPTEMDWKKETYVWQRRNEDMCAYVSTMMDETSIAEASVVPISWLEGQFAKLKAQGHETIRIAASSDGRIYIEGMEDEANNVRGYPGDPTMDPPGWNNDWPKIALP